MDCVLRHVYVTTQSIKESINLGHSINESKNIKEPLVSDFLLACSSGESSRTSRRSNRRDSVTIPPDSKSILLADQG